MDFSLKENPRKESTEVPDFHHQIYQLLVSESDAFEVVLALDRILGEWSSPEFMALARQPGNQELEWVYARYLDRTVSLPAGTLNTNFRERLTTTGHVLNLDKAEFASLLASPMLSSDLSDVHSFSIFPLRSGDDLRGFLLLGTSSENRLPRDTVNTLELLSCHLGALLQLSEARGKLASKTRQFEIILNHAGEGINIIDSDYNIRYANAWTQRRFATQPNVHKCYKAFFGAEEPCSGCPINAPPGTKNSVRRTSGRDSFSMFLHPLSGGKSEFFIEIIQDGTIRARYEEVIAEKSRLNSVVEFARAVGHELNQPLTGISGYCALIKEEVDVNSAIYRDVVEIEKQATRLERTVVKFQNIAHLDYSENVENGKEQDNNDE